MFQVVAVAYTIFVQMSSRDTDHTSTTDDCQAIRPKLAAGRPTGVAKRLPHCRLRRMKNLLD
jgi:hypothetical protein